VLSAALFYLSIAVGGLFNFRGMQLGIAVGAMLVALMYLLLLAVMLTG
jgi:ABC-type enterobactin transport system permease subunit